MTRRVEPDERVARAVGDPERAAAPGERGGSSAAEVDALRDRSRGGIDARQRVTGHARPPRRSHLRSRSRTGSPPIGTRSEVAPVARSTRVTRPSLGSASQIEPSPAAIAAGAPSSSTACDAPEPRAHEPARGRRDRSPRSCPPVPERRSRPRQRRRPRPTTARHRRAAACARSRRRSLRRAARNPLVPPRGRDRGRGSSAASSCSSRARLEPELVGEPAPPAWYAARASAWRPARYSARMSWPSGRSRCGCARTILSSSDTSSALRPSARSASIRSSCASVRRSSSRAASSCAKGS